MNRCNQQRASLSPKWLRLGTVHDFSSLPRSLQTESIATALGLAWPAQLENLSISRQLSSPTMVCGSPYEVANNPFNGGNTARGAFDAASDFYQTSKKQLLASQKRSSWLQAVMTDIGQLRQRAAWALSQIFAIHPLSIGGGFRTAESFTVRLFQ